MTEEEYFFFEFLRNYQNGMMVDDLLWFAFMVIWFTVPFFVWAIWTRLGQMAAIGEEIKTASVRLKRIAEATERANRIAIGGPE